MCIAGPVFDENWYELRHGWRPNIRKVSNSNVAGARMFEVDTQYRKHQTAVKFVTSSSHANNMEHIIRNNNKKKICGNDSNQTNHVNEF